VVASINEFNSVAWRTWLLGSGRNLSLPVSRRVYLRLEGIDPVFLFL
jgi:hypothetical protein